MGIVRLAVRIGATTSDEHFAVGPVQTVAAALDSFNYTAIAALSAGLLVDHLSDGTGEPAALKGATRRPGVGPEVRNQPSVPGYRHASDPAPVFDVEGANRRVGRHSLQKPVASLGHARVAAHALPHLRPLRAL